MKRAIIKRENKLRLSLHAFRNFSITSWLNNVNLFGKSNMAFILTSHNLPFKFITTTLKKYVASIYNHRDIMYYPRYKTFMEINHTEGLGKEIFNIFSGSTFEPEFAKSIKSHQQWKKILSTGAENRDEGNLKNWFYASTIVVVMGFQLISTANLENENFEELHNLVAQTLVFILQLVNCVP